LRGKVEGAPVPVEVRTRTGRLEAEWEPGRPSICLPLVGSEMGRTLDVAWRPQDGTLHLDAIELVSDLDPASSVPGILPAPAPGLEIVVPLARIVVAELRSAAVVDLEE